MANDHHTARIPSFISSTFDGALQTNASLFVATFFLMMYAGPTSTVDAAASACSASPDIAKRTVGFQLLAFFFFLFASVTAWGLKTAVLVRGPLPVRDAAPANWVAYGGVLAMHAGSAVGYACLAFALTDLAQITLGRVSCGGLTMVVVTAVFTAHLAGIVLHVGVIVYFIRSALP